MSTTRSAAAKAAGLSDWDRLELAVRRLLEYQEALIQRAQSAEQRIRELEAGIAEVTAGRLDPVALSERATALERENRALEERLGQAREGVQRILTRLRFTEEES